MTVEFPDVAVGLLIAVLSFLFGGGAAARWFRRAGRLIDAADLKEHFISRDEFKALEKESNEWRQRMLTDVIEPQREFARTIAALATTSAVQTESIKFLATSLQDVSQDLRELRRERRQ